MFEQDWQTGYDLSCTDVQQEADQNGSNNGETGPEATLQLDDGSKRQISLWVLADSTVCDWTSA